MLHHYEKDNPPPPEPLLNRLREIEISLGIHHSTDVELADPKTPNDSGFSKTSKSGRVPVLGWAHAGAAESYEQLPNDWQDWISTDCRDEKAFGVFLEGDSMEPYYREGDTLILMPSEEIHNGCLAVIRFVNDGVIFRRVETMKDKIRLVPFNKSYEAEDYQAEDISWAYPVYERRTRLWRG